MIKPLKERSGFTCTFNTTEECNLRCKYCYEVNKRPRVLRLDYAKSFIDHVLADPDPAGLLDDPDPVFSHAYRRGLIFDFIGGDSLMNIDLLEDISAYAIRSLYLTDTEHAKMWRGNFTMSLSTNGTLFGSERVRRWCTDYKDILGLGVSIDGCPEIHDRNRIFADGKGSMASILKHWDWYRKEFPLYSRQTKATANRETIPYLYDSLKFMHEEMEIDYINQNFIMEDMHLVDEDLKELDRQMEKCIDYVLQHSDDLYWSMIGEDQFAKAKLSTDDRWEKEGYCGSGAMPALSVDGNIYPCIRWLPHTQVDKTPFVVGSAKEGFIHKEIFKKVREGAYRANCTKEEKCRTCDIESACAYCIGGCYSEFGEFRRTTYSCEVNKLLVKWAREYWRIYNGRHNNDK